MPRSIKKGAYVAHHLQKKINDANTSKKHTPIKTWSRSSMITPDFVGLTLAIHNGRKFIPLFVTEDMVGHKLGEFSMTRTYKGHTTKGKK